MSRGARSGERELSEPGAPRAVVPLGQGFEAPLAHRLAERAITGVAFVAIAAIVLIFVFILKDRKSVV